MYSSYISASVVNQSTSDPNMLLCEFRVMFGDAIYGSMELYPVDYWYQYNVDGFGKIHYNEWDTFWFSGTLDGWSV